MAIRLTPKQEWDLFIALFAFAIDVQRQKYLSPIRQEKPDE